MNAVIVSPRTIVVSCGTVMGCLGAARRYFGFPLNGHREICRSGEDGLYRSELECGLIVESIIRYREVAKVLTIDPL